MYSSLDSFLFYDFLFLEYVKWKDFIVITYGIYFLNVCIVYFTIYRMVVY